MRIYVGTSPVGRILAPCSVKKLRNYFIDHGKDKWDLSVDIGNQAAKEGVWDLRRSGLEKVRAGLTSLEEVNSVTTE